MLWKLQNVVLSLTLPEDEDSISISIHRSAKIETSLLLHTGILICLC